MCTLLVGLVQVTKHANKYRNPNTGGKQLTLTPASNVCKSVYYSLVTCKYSLFNSLKNKYFEKVAIYFLPLSFSTTNLI